MNPWGYQGAQPYYSPFVGGGGGGVGGGGNWIGYLDTTSAAAAQPQITLTTTGVSPTGCTCKP